MTQTQDEILLACFELAVRDGRVDKETGAPPDATEPDVGEPLKLEVVQLPMRRTEIVYVPLSNGRKVPRFPAEEQPCSVARSKRQEAVAMAEQAIRMGKKFDAYYRISSWIGEYRHCGLEAGRMLVIGARLSRHETKLRMSTQGDLIDAGLVLAGLDELPTGNWQEISIFVEPRKDSAAQEALHALELATEAVVFTNQLKQQRVPVNSAGIARMNKDLFASLALVHRIRAIVGWNAGGASVEDDIRLATKYMEKIREIEAIHGGRTMNFDIPMADLALLSAIIKVDQGVPIDRISGLEHNGEVYGRAGRWGAPGLERLRQLREASR